MRSIHRFRGQLGITVSGKAGRAIIACSHRPCHLQSSIAAQPSGELTQQKESNEYAEKRKRLKIEVQRIDGHSHMSFAVEERPEANEKMRKAEGARQLRKPIIAASAGPLTLLGSL